MTDIYGKLITDAGGYGADDVVIYKHGEYATPIMILSLHTWNKINDGIKRQLKEARIEEKPTINITRVFGIKHNSDFGAWDIDIGYRKKHKSYPVVTKGNYSYATYDRTIIRVNNEVFVSDFMPTQLTSLIAPVRKEEIEE